jgi:hypothetical protein
MNRLVTAGLLEEGHEDCQSKDLPDGLGRLHCGNQSNQHCVPEPLAHQKHNEHHDYKGNKGHECSTTGTDGEPGRTLKGLSLGKICLINNGIDGTRDGVSKHGGFYPLGIKSRTA